MTHRHFICLALSLLTPLFLFAQCISGNCIDGTGTYSYPSGAKYIGDFQKGKMNGWGMCTYSNGSIYKGEWKNEGNTIDIEALLNGQPKNERNALVAKNANGEGCISGNCTDGQGVYVYKNHSARYEGSFQGEQAHGKGTIYYANGDVYIGDWVAGYFEGKGVLTLSDGKRISGYWKASVHVGDSNPFEATPTTRQNAQICIADACHSGGLLAMKGADANNALLKYYEALAQSSPGSALILSSKSSETSLESSGLRQGVFSHFLIRGLKGEADTNFDNIIGVQELFDFTYHNVRSYTGSRQSPVIKGNFDRRMPVAVIR